MAFLIICTLLIPAVQLLAGWAMRFHAPKKINAWVGYRTERSMQNEESWKFANQYCGRLWMLFGAAMLVVSAASCISLRFVSKKTAALLAAVAVSVQTAELLLTLFPVERALKKKFQK
ncbi:SdpI family protein [Ruminococcus sp.]